MKKLTLFGIAMLAMLAMVSCGSSKNLAVQSKTENAKSIEGENVIVETTKLQGVDMVEALSEDGKKIEKVPYKWFAGIGKANDKQTAIEMAELEARASVSRIIDNAALTQSERGSVMNNGEVQKALKSHWQQVGMSIQKACEPFGDTKVEYDPTTKMYTAIQMVGIRGDMYQQILNQAADFKPSTLKDDELKQFIDANKSITKAAQAK